MAARKPEPATAVNLTELVRVKHAATGHHYTTTRALADADPDLTIIDRPAVDATGRPRPATPNVPLTTVAPEEATE